MTAHHSVWSYVLLIQWLLIYNLFPVKAANLNAGAAIKVNQANETGIQKHLDTSLEEIGPVERGLSAGLLFTSYLTVIEVATAPTQTITAFYDGNEYFSLRTASPDPTAATLPTPTAYHPKLMKLAS
ncbi:hypothetical protein TWF694_001016 [Orbilia ellipsospora]|uniref:Uncharacterized protein n=1 Tax=Orbilia ellipsospora TaxID=2528407 RepID=A0AAV9XRW1_9PEZI